MRSIAGCPSADSHIFKKHYPLSTSEKLEKLAGKRSTPTLFELGVIKKLGDGLKILGTGPVDGARFTVEAHTFPSRGGKD